MKQRVKVNGKFSSWQESVKGVPQGSILGLLLFNIFLNDLFYLVEETETCNYADDTTIYKCSQELEQVVTSLKNDGQRNSTCFFDNSMKLNLINVIFDFRGGGGIQTFQYILARLW